MRGSLCENKGQDLKDRRRREKEAKLIETTVGKPIFNEAIPQNAGFVDRTNPETMFNGG